MNVVDSSGWLEYFSGSSLASKYTRYLEKPAELLVPSLVLYEVYRWIKRHTGEEEALKYVAKMNEGKVIPLDDTLALFAADLALEHRLALADSVVYATALNYNAKLITSDSDFKHLPHVTYFAKSSS